MKEQMYQDKLSHLKKQLQQLSDGTHPEWLKRIKKLDTGLKERMFINTVIKDLELEMAEQDFLSEKKKDIITMIQIKTVLMTLWLKIHSISFRQRVFFKKTRYGKKLSL